MGEGTTFSQSPACGRPDESANARNRIVGLRTGVMPHRWHVRGGVVGWGYRYLLDPASPDGQQL